MGQFRMMPVIRLVEGPVAVWYYEGVSRDGRFKWITEQLQTMAAHTDSDVSHSVFVYTDGAIAWFAADTLHYLPGPLSDVAQSGAVDAAQIAAILHQTICRMGCLEAGMNAYRHDQSMSRSA